MYIEARLRMLIKNCVDKETEALVTTSRNKTDEYW